MPGKKEDFTASYIPAFVTDTFYVDAANVFARDKAELGRYLFYDRRLSVNNTKSCASCHAPQFSFTDSYTRSIGALGDLHQRNARPLINIVFQRYLTSADSSLHYPEQQMNNPMLNIHPVELGIAGNEATILAKIKNDTFYNSRLRHIFPGENDPFTLKNIQYCISCFVRTIISFNAPYDKYVQGDQAALTGLQKEGMQLFFGPQLNCSSCHGGSNFSTPSIKDAAGNTQYYFNTGLYNVDGRGNYPAYDQGLIETTKQPADMGCYRVPTLRNLAFTAPYYHDGSAATLEEVITAYANGGRIVATGIYKGNGTANPHKNKLIHGFNLTSRQRTALTAFLFSLTDSTIIKNPAFANPFKEDETKNSR